MLTLRDYLFAGGLRACQPSSTMTRRISLSCSLPRTSALFTTAAGIKPRGSALVVTRKLSAACQQHAHEANTHCCKDTIKVPSPVSKNCVTAMSKRARTTFRRVGHSGCTMERATAAAEGGEDSSGATLSISSRLSCDWKITTSRDEITGTR